MDDLTSRPAWIEQYFNNRRGADDPINHIRNRCPCPCCGYLTLLMRENYEICELCYWEDDGQGDDEADDVWGGPNQDYSLTQARSNFKLYLSMYDPKDDPRCWRDTAILLHAKLALISLFQSFDKHKRKPSVERIAS